MLFEVQSYYKYDKRATIIGPDELRLYVDLDDTPRHITEPAMHRLVEVLNKYYEVIDE